MEFIQHIDMLQVIAVLLGVATVGMIVELFQNVTKSR